MKQKILRRIRDLEHEISGIQCELNDLYKYDIQNIFTQLQIEALQKRQETKFSIKNELLSIISE